jgi:predicted O-methyltransferase YrrM
VKLHELCASLERQLPLSNAEVFEPFDIPDGYPWKDKTTDDSNMYACLYGLAAAEENIEGILEIGTGHGLSTMTWLHLLDKIGKCEFKMLKMPHLVTIDIGGFEGHNNIEQARRRLFSYHSPSGRRPHFMCLKVSTQPGTGWPWWYNTALTHQLAQREGFDILFLDGDHGDVTRPWALFNDLWQFWPFLRLGGLCICDDLHSPVDYPSDRFPWLPYTWKSFQLFEVMMENQIEDHYIWDYPYVPSGKRPVGLLRKKL